MITLEDLQKASEKLDKMYAEEVYPRVLAFREAWDKLSAPFITDSTRDLERRHGIEFMPSKEIAENVYLLCGLARTALTVRTLCKGNDEEHTFVKNIGCKREEPCPTIIEATGHNNCFGAWGGICGESSRETAGFGPSPR